MIHQTLVHGFKHDIKYNTVDSLPAGLSEIPASRVVHLQNPQAI